MSYGEVARGIGFEGEKSGDCGEWEFGDTVVGDCTT